MDLTGLGQLFNIERPSVDSSKDFIRNTVRLDAVIGLIAHDDRGSTAKVVVEPQGVRGSSFQARAVRAKDG